MTDRLTRRPRLGLSTPVQIAVLALLAGAAHAQSTPPADAPAPAPQACGVCEDYAP